MGVEKISSCKKKKTHSCRGGKCAGGTLPLMPQQCTGEHCAVRGDHSPGIQPQITFCLYPSDCMAVSQCDDVNNKLFQIKLSFSEMLHVHLASSADSKACRYSFIKLKFPDEKYIFQIFFWLDWGVTLFPLLITTWRFFDNDYYSWIWPWSTSE